MSTATCAWCGANLPEEDLAEHLDGHTEEMRAETTDEEVVDIDEESYERYE